LGVFVPDTLALAVVENPDGMDEFSHYFMILKISLKEQRKAHGIVVGGDWGYTVLSYMGNNLIRIFIWWNKLDDANGTKEIVLQDSDNT